MRSVLVANRGEIACRVLRACREAGLQAVAVHAEDEAGALHTELADLSLPLEGSGALRTSTVKPSSLRPWPTTSTAFTPVSASSQSAQVAQAVIDAGLIWIGPSPSAIERMGDKMTARITMREAGVLSSLERKLKSNPPAMRTQTLRPRCPRCVMPLHVSDSPCC